MEGDCPEARRIIDCATTIAENDNCPVSYGDVEGANGYYVPALHRIVIEQSLSVNQRAKTLVHELVHSKVHRYDKKSTKTEKEVVAEGTAFIVCSFFGLDTSDYSFRYVYGWNKDSDSLMKYGTQICDVAKGIIEEFQKLMVTDEVLEGDEEEQIA